MKSILRKLLLGFVAIGMVSILGLSNIHVASTTLVISQVNGGGGGTTGTYLFDYVEIKNVSATPQSLNGLSLYYGSALGQFASTAGNAFALPNVTINPGQYYFVQTGPTGTIGAAFPVTPDAVTGNLTMSGTNGKVALATSGLAINTCGATATPCSPAQLALLVDWVAYGAAGNGVAGVGEGGTSVNNNASLTSSQGGVRKLNGCTDTDNNNLDFDVITAPVPRNLATTAAPCGGPVLPVQHVVDFNGDGKTDYAVVRNTGGGPSGQLTWLTQMNGSAATMGSQWGIASDVFVSGDFDGDGKSDVSVWRTGTQGFFYTLRSSNSTLDQQAFGQTGDDPSVVGDYDADGKTDITVYRAGASSGLQSTWYYRGSMSNPSGITTFVPWGQNGDFPAPGDYDGDKKNDFVVQRNGGGGTANFFINRTTGGIGVVNFGTPTDVIVPGDYDGDGKTDIATVRGVAGQLNWFWLPSSGGAFQTRIFGASATDFITQGDYDGDGKTEPAVWRPSATAGLSGFYSLSSLTGNSIYQSWGANGDAPVANFNRH